MIKPLIYNYFSFNSVSSLTLGIQISGSGTYNSPERAIERISVPGRNGDLIRDLGKFNNVIIQYPAFIFGHFPNRSSDFRNVMLKDPFYHRLEDSYHPDEFRMASYAGPFESDPLQNKSGNFTISFNCKPQRFLKSGESKIDLKTETILNNPTFQTSLPLIVVLSGTGEININGEIVNLKKNENGVVIDCDIQEAYSKNGNLNLNGDLELTTGSYPILIPGINSILIPESMNSYIIPRWWRL